jgi:integrase
VNGIILKAHRACVAAKLKPCTFREAFQRACRNAGLEPITFHELRHAFVTNALRATKDLAGVSKAAGHSDPGYTARRYGHLVTEWSLAIADATAAYVRKAARASRQGVAGG